MRRVWIGLGVVWVLFLGCLGVAWLAWGHAPSVSSWLAVGCGIVSVLCGLLTSRTATRQHPAADPAGERDRPAPPD